jgi:glycosyltransferase involved in cell wall biosynthesis
LLISICIPAYNNARSLKTCLDSVFMQTWKDFELLISDDSTNPEVEELVRSYGSEPRLVYVHNALPLGSPVNWNNALHLAKGRYIKIMHHDDYFTSPNSLQQFVNYIEKEPSVSFFFCQSRVYFKKEKEYFIHKQTRTQLNRLVQNPVFLLFRNVIGAPSATCFKNDPLIRFDKDYKWLVDAEFYIRYLIKHRSFRMIPQPLVTVVDGEDG